MTEDDRERIRRLIAGAPPLAPEQIAKLRDLLPPVPPPESESPAEVPDVAPLAGASV